MNPVIEGLRGLGAILVMVHHYIYHLSPEWAQRLTAWHVLHSGVDLFFVLTGFLFAPLWLGERHSSWRSFARRRFWRLYPMYGLSLALALVLQWSTLTQPWRVLLEHLLMLQTLPGHDLPDIARLSDVYWTLPVEVSFYLMLGVLMLSGQEGPAPGWGLWSRWCLLALILFILGYGLGYQPFDGDWIIRQAQLPVLLIEFVIGAGVYRWLSRSPQGVGWVWGPLAFATFGLILAGCWYPATIKATPRPFGGFNLLVAASSAALLMGLLQAQRLQRWPSLGAALRPLALRLGAWSYGLYLFHGLVMQAIEQWAGWHGNLAVFLAVCTSVVLAAILYRYVEAPCRAWGRR